jgi:hypothetical protein
MPARLRILVILLLIIYAFFAQIPVAHADDSVVIENKIIWKSMSQRERIQIIKVYREWKSQKGEIKKKIIRNYKVYHKLSPADKQKLKARFEAFRNLEPSKRKLIKERVRKVESLPPKNQKEIREKYKKIKRKSLDEKMKFIEQTMFWRSLAESEREMFRRLMFP